jgi:hypothetical protein
MAFEKRSFTTTAVAGGRLRHGYPLARHYRSIDADIRHHRLLTNSIYTKHFSVGGQRN